MNEHEIKPGMLFGKIFFLNENIKIYFIVLAQTDALVTCLWFDDYRVRQAKHSLFDYCKKID